MDFYKEDAGKPQSEVNIPEEDEEEAPEDPSQALSIEEIIHVITEMYTNDNVELLCNSFNDLVNLLRGNEPGIRKAEKIGIYKLIYKMLLESIPNNTQIIEVLLGFTARLSGNEYSTCSFFVNGSFYRLLAGLLPQSNYRHVILSIFANTMDDKFNRDAFLNVVNLSDIHNIISEEASNEPVLMSAARLMLGITQFDLEENYMQSVFDIAVLLVNTSFNEVEYYGLYSIHYLLMHQSKFVHTISANTEFISFIIEKFENEDFRIVEISLKIITDIAACEEFAGNLQLEDLLPFINSEELRVATAAENCIKNIIVSSRLTFIGDSDLSNLMKEISDFAQGAHYFAKGALINSLECVIRNLSNEQIINFVKAGITDTIIECSSVTETVPLRNFLHLVRRILKACCFLDESELEIAASTIDQLADAGVFDTIDDIQEDESETTSHLAHDVLAAHADVMIRLEESGIIH